MDTFLTIGGYILAIGSFLGVIALILAMVLRRVVDTNQVHIVQSSKKTVSYGKQTDNGNVYYEIPSWVPALGVKVIELPVSNFDLSLNGYDAYDQDRVPVVVDITAFFRIKDTNKAAQRVETIHELKEQLTSVVRGAVRSVLASHTIDAIMTQRETFGDSFTQAVESELEQWGVEPVKNLELMDIRDSSDSKVIHNIMAKKKSHIEMESRKEVANNNKEAEIAEIEAKQAADIRQEEADQKVGERTAEKTKAVGIAEEQAQQQIKEQQKTTAEKDMAVKQVEQTREAEILRDVAEVAASEAEFKADAIRKEGEAEADVRQKLFEADNALEIRLKIQKETAIGVAEKLAEGGMQLVPQTFIGGGNGENSPADPLQNLMSLLTAGFAQQQNVELPNKKADKPSSSEDN